MGEREKRYSPVREQPICGSFCFFSACSFCNDYHFLSFLHRIGRATQNSTLIRQPTSRKPQPTLPETNKAGRQRTRKRGHVYIFTFYDLSLHPSKETLRLMARKRGGKAFCNITKYITNKKKDKRSKAHYLLSVDSQKKKKVFTGTRQQRRISRSPMVRFTSTGGQPPPATRANSWPWTAW